MAGTPGFDGRLHLDDLQAFLAVVEEGGVSPAARHLDVPKSTISRRLVRLEEGLGTALVDRSTRQLYLTEAGRDLVPHARALLDEADVLVARATGVLTEPPGVLKVAAPPDLAAFPALWTELPSRYPRLELEVVFHRHPERLLREGFDVALRQGPTSDPTLIGRQVGTYTRRAVAAPAWVQAHASLPSLEALHQHDAVLLEPLPRRAELPSTAPPEPFRHTVLGDLGLVRQAACQGLGVALLPAHLVQPDLDAGRLLSVLASPQVIPIHAVYAQQRTLTGRTVALIRHVEQHLGHETAR